MKWAYLQIKQQNLILSNNNSVNTLLSSFFQLSLPMATLHFTTSPSFTFTSSKKQSSFLPPVQLNQHVQPRLRRGYRSITTIKSYKVTIEHEGKTTELQVEPDETILTKALDEGMTVPYDCNLGVCMTCPAQLISGKVDQSEGMLSDDVVERGFALLCAAYPRSDCHIKTIPEEELLAMQLATAND